MPWVTAARGGWFALIERLPADGSPLSGGKESPPLRFALRYRSRMRERRFFFSSGTAAQDGPGGPHDPGNRSRRAAASRDAAPVDEDQLKEEEDVVTVRAAIRTRQREERQHAAGEWRRTPPAAPPTSLFRVMVAFNEFTLLISRVTDSGINNVVVLFCKNSGKRKTKQNKTHIFVPLHAGFESQHLCK